MSIADKLSQLTTIRGDIRSALADKGISASEHDFADFAQDIEDIQTGGTSEFVSMNNYAEMIVSATYNGGEI